MKDTIKKLWCDYMADECGRLESDEEKELTAIALELHDKAHAELNKKQSESIEKYIDALLELEALHHIKAFSKGLEFGISFFLEIMN